MRFAVLVAGLSLAAVAGAQDVRENTTFQILKLREVEKAAEALPAFPNLRTGDSGTLVIAGFNGSQMTVAIVRSKGVDPPADLVAAQKIAEQAGLKGVDFNIQEGKMTSSVEMDFSESISRSGTALSGSVPLGKIVASLREWKDLPKPIYIVIGGKDGTTIQGQTTSIAFAQIDKVGDGDVIRFRMDVATWGFAGALFLVAMAVLIFASPYFVIRQELRKPIVPEAINSVEDLRKKRLEQAKALKVFMFVPLIYLFILGPKLLPVDVMKQGVLLLLGPRLPHPAWLLVIAPFMIVSLSAPGTIRWWRRRKLPALEETLQERTAKRQIATSVTMMVTMMGGAALVFVLMATQAKWSHLVAGVPVMAQFGVILGLFGLVMVFALAMALKNRANPGEPLPVGHRLIDPVHDAGRACGVHVQQVSVIPGDAITVGMTLGGNFFLTEPVVTLIPDVEAKSLIALSVARTKGRLIGMIPFLLLFVVLGGAFIVARPILREDSPVPVWVFFAILLGSVVGAAVGVNYLAQPRLWRNEKEALEFAVRHTGRPMDVLRALARQASLQDVKPNKKPGRKTYPMHVTDMFNIVRAHALEEGMVVSDEDPFLLIARENLQRDRPREEMLRNACALFNRKDLDGWLALMTEDVDWPAMRGGMRVVGRGVVRDYWLQQFREVDPRLTPVELRTREKDVIEMLVDELIRDLQGRAMTAGSVRHVYTFREGLIARMDVEEF
jgi:hypothetical protein